MFTERKHVKRYNKIELELQPDCQALIDAHMYKQILSKCEAYRATLGGPFEVNLHNKLLYMLAMAADSFRGV